MCKGVNVSGMRLIALFSFSLQVFSVRVIFVNSFSGLDTNSCPKMSEEGEDVYLYIYDLSNGMARMMSPSIIGEFNFLISQNACPGKLPGGERCLGCNQ